MFQNAHPKTQCVCKKKHARLLHHTHNSQNRTLVAKRLREATSNSHTPRHDETAAGDRGTMVKDDSVPAVSTRKRKAEEEHVQPLGASSRV